MSPALSLAVEREAGQFQKGVRHLCDSGIKKVPRKYILPPSARPNNNHHDTNPSLNLPVIDFSQLQGPNRDHTLQSLSKACQEFGFFQVINHGITTEVIFKMIDASRRFCWVCDLNNHKTELSSFPQKEINPNSFFELPFDVREKYMSADVCAPVRYGTSFNQKTDGIFCWRDFLKLSCHPLPEVLPFWPSSPDDFRDAAGNYSKQVKFLYLMLMEAILESLGLLEISKEKKEYESMKELEDGTQLMIVNCYPSCPEPDLTLGMPPHSDYGLLTLLLQDEVKGLQIQHHGKWVTVEPIQNSFVVNVGDHLEIFSNGRYKSVLHRVVVNSSKPRISIASLHSRPVNSVIRPSLELIDDGNPRRYKDTDFASFLEYISSCELKNKSFLDSRKLT